MKQMEQMKQIASFASFVGESRLDKREMECTLGYSLIRGAYNPLLAVRTVCECWK
jgi:hypothetical protein